MKLGEIVVRMDNYNFTKFHQNQMKNIFLLIVSCAKQPKAVLICGDHECINKAEAEFYFKENLSLEVKIIDPNITIKPVTLVV